MLNERHESQWEEVGRRAKWRRWDLGNDSYELHEFL